MNRLLTALARTWFRLVLCRANSGGGGFDHWYCQKRRWHPQQTPAKGLVGFDHVHRYRNYTWTDGSKTNYEPVPFDIRRPRAHRLELGPRNPRPHHTTWKATV